MIAPANRTMTCQRWLLLADKFMSFILVSDLACCTVELK